MRTLQKSSNAGRPHPAKLDKDRDLLAEFQTAGFKYAADKTALDSIDAGKTDRLLGLFAHSNMNVALDKVDGRRNKARGITGRVVDDYGFPDQPMLDEMTAKALGVLERQKNGFVLMVEGASIDKQAHNMDTERCDAGHHRIRPHHQAGAGIRPQTR